MGTNETRQRIAHLHAYVSLQLSLEPGEGGARNPEIRGVLNEVGEFLQLASRRDLQTRGRQLEALLWEVIKFRGHFKPRRALGLIGSDFIALGKTQDIWRYGIAYGWLAEQFQPPILALPPDLPAHARIGLGHHAGSVAIEEGTLLDDAFFLWELTNRAYDHMMTSSQRLDEPRSAREAQVVHQVLTQLNLNVATFARLTVVTIAAFMESFINSVGSNEAFRRPQLAPEVAEQLKGMRKGRFLALEYKVERFPALIRPDGQSPIRVLDETQRLDPFRRFFNETKGVRDAAMHFAPSKEAIICTPQEWVRRAENAVTDAVGVAQEFWVACYPSAGLPAYLYGLDHVCFKDRAQKRVAAGEVVTADLAG
jgi:hypothetical protein